MCNTFVKGCGAFFQKIFFLIHNLLILMQIEGVSPSGSLLAGFSGHLTNASRREKEVGGLVREASGRRSRRLMDGGDADPPCPESSQKLQERHHGLHRGGAIGTNLDGPREEPLLVL